MADLRSIPVRGRYHEALRALLESGRKAGLFTQESLGEDLGLDQTTIGKYLKNKAGTLDLDEADKALTHVGTNLRAFVQRPDVNDIKIDIPATFRRLLQDESFSSLVEVLAPLPLAQRQRVVGHLLGLARELAPPRRGGR